MRTAAVLPPNSEVKRIDGSGGFQDRGNGIESPTVVQTTLTTPSATGSTTMDETQPFNDGATSWMMQGNCRLYPPKVFFPSDGVGVDKARKICAGCPVTEQCLEYALEHRIDHGVWGGCSERERRRILKRRRLSVAS